jgi:hypothetical protein
MDSAWNMIWFITFIIGAIFFFGIALWVSITGIADVKDLLKLKKRDV